MSAPEIFTDRLVLRDWKPADREPGRFLGFTGLSVPGFEAAFVPAVEVGWRLARWAWGHGDATEAAVAALDFGFTVAGLAEVASFTSNENPPLQGGDETLGHEPGSLGRL